MSESQYAFLLFFGRKKKILLNNKFTKVKFLEFTRVRNILKAHIPLSECIYKLGTYIHIVDNEISTYTCICKLTLFHSIFNTCIRGIFTWLLCNSHFKKTKISEGYLVRENVKSLSNSVTKFCDQGICEKFYFFRH